MSKNKFGKNREPKTKKDKVRVEMNNPNAVNPELEEREKMSDLQFLEEMINQIKARKTQLLEQIKQLRDETQVQAQIKRVRDMVKILNLDLEHTKSLYEKEKRGRKR